MKPYDGMWRALRTQMSEEWLQWNSRVLTTKDPVDIYRAQGRNLAFQAVHEMMDQIEQEATEAPEKYVPTET